MSRRAAAGFTLLEVLLATAIMAVGTTSVLVVIATAAGMASKRQVDARREQVVDEARHDAQTIVDLFRPGVPEAAQKIATKQGAAKPQGAVKHAPDNVLNKASSRFGGFTYDLVFSAKDDSVLEKGFNVDVTVHYGGGDLSYATSTSMISTVIPPEEFATSRTWLEEQQGSDQTKPRGKK